MNVVEQLLKLDEGKVELPTEEVTLKLNKLGGVEVIFTCQALDNETSNEINQMNMEIKSDGKIEMDTAMIQLQTLLAGVPELKDKSLLDHFGAKTPDVLINKILLPGDITKLTDTISKLSGFDKTTERKKKDKIKKL